MSERQLSKRSQRQLRLRVAQRLAGSAVPTKKPRIEPATSTNHREDGDDAESSDQEAYREVEVTADSSGEGEGGESCGNVEDVEGSDDDNPSESYIAGEDREGVSDGELSALVTASEDDFSEGSSDEDMTSVSERGSIATGTQSEGTPLFQESAVKSEDFNTAFLSLVQRHNLTYSSQGDILKLLSIVLPSPSNIPSSAHVLYKKFTNYKDDTVVQHFCDNCTCLLEPGSSCKQQKCAKASCGVFVRIPLSMQLKERFDDPEFPYLLKYRFRREQKYGILADIYDGLEYCKHSEFFASEYNVSFALNFDGAPRFKSSSVQVWPILLYLNELPPHVRGSRQHMFLAGIWCSVKKPPTRACLGPIVEELQDLATNGVQVTVRGEEVTCKARLLFTVTDLPAKASLTNMIQFNGKFGCPTCKHEGKQVSIGRGSTRAYGYQPVTLRSHSKHLKYAIKAEATNQSVYGVKGRSILHNLAFDIINNNPIDYMHCVLLGVVRMLISLWFDSKNHKEPWYIGRRISDAEARVLGVKPPDVVTRIPRAFRGRGWKGTVFDAKQQNPEPSYFTIYHCCMESCLTSTLHMLCKAMRLLLADEVSLADIDIADKLLCLYWRLTEEYYGLKHCKMNVHLLSHLSHYVKLFGPLWTHSAFTFEDAIGSLVKKSHGTHDIANQIVTSFILQWRLHVQRKLMQGPLILKSFVDHLDTKSRSTQRCTQLSESIAAVGVAKIISLDNEDKSLLTPLLEKNSVVINAYGTVKLWSKIILQDKVTINSQVSKRITKRNSYTVTFVDPERPSYVRYGRIQKFVCCPPDSQDGMNAAIVQELKVHRCMELEALDFPSDIQCLSDLVCSDYVSVVGELPKLAIPLEQIVAQCFDISSVDMCVIASMVCHSEVLK